MVARSQGRGEKRNAAAAASLSAAEAGSPDVGISSAISNSATHGPPFMISNFDTVAPGVSLHTNGCAWAPTSGHWVTYDWGERGASCCGLRDCRERQQLA
jgi:hypothetical protein